MLVSACRGLAGAFAVLPRTMPGSQRLPSAPGRHGRACGKALGRPSSSVPSASSGLTCARLPSVHWEPHTCPPPCPDSPFQPEPPGAPGVGQVSFPACCWGQEAHKGARLRMRVAQRTRPRVWALVGGFRELPRKWGSALDAVRKRG